MRARTVPAEHGIGDLSGASSDGNGPPAWPVNVSEAQECQQRQGLSVLVVG